MTVIADCQDTHIRPRYKLLCPMPRSQGGGEIFWSSAEGSATIETTLLGGQLMPCLS